MFGMDLQQIVAIVGTPFGIWLGQQLGTKAEARRWLREWQVTQIQERRAFASEACSAVDALILVHEMARREEQQSGPDASQERMAEATRVWRSVLGRRYVYADACLQHALTQLDTARAASAEAINNHDDQRVTEAAKMLDQARLAIFDAVQEFLNVIQEALATHISAAMPWWSVGRWRLKPPVAPMPSTMAKAERDEQERRTPMHEAR